MLTRRHDIDDETFIREMSEWPAPTPAQIAVKRRSLGAKSKPNEPFKDRRGQWYIRDSQG